MNRLLSRALLPLALLAVVLALRGPSWGVDEWNLDESIHAAAARTILHGGALYRDAIDQRTPLTYHVVAAIFAVAGENNLTAVRVFVALLIAGTSWLLYLAGCRLGSRAAGIFAAALFAVVPTVVLPAGDAYAANTEWFVAFFSAAAAVVWLGEPALPSARRSLATGALFGAAFLSKQPALLDLGAPLAALAYLAWQRRWTGPTLLSRVGFLAAGWLLPVGATALYLLARGAWTDAVFYTWTYNLRYYGPEISLAGRITAGLLPFERLFATLPLLLVAWLAGSGTMLLRVAQRTPDAADVPGNPGRMLVLSWTLLGLLGTASGGRAYDHYSIQFLAPWCLGAGLVLARIGEWVRGHASVLKRSLAALVLAGIAWQLSTTAGAARHRTAPIDPSQRVARYIRAHSTPADRVFAWGYQPEVYLYSDRLPASRFLYCSFVTGLVPWTNVAPELDTSYAAVPGALEQMMRDLAATRPKFIVDCSVGPNRHWGKYPPDKFPAFAAFLRANYRQVEAHVFLHQGFRLYQRREPGEAADANLAVADDVLATLGIGTLGAPLQPVRAEARFGLAHRDIDGRDGFFAHAPSSIVYHVGPRLGALRGNFAIREAAYAPGQVGPTDGAEFLVKWRPLGGAELILFRRLLRPATEPGDRGLQAFRATWTPGAEGEIELEINPGPADQASSDWTYWTGLLFESVP